MANRFWVGGTSTWNTTASTKWSTTSGGASGAAVPTAADDVFLDSNSGAGTVTLSGTQPCRSLDCTGFTGTFATGGATLNVGDASGGKFVLVAGMSISSGAATTFNFVSTSSNGGAGWTWDFGGKTFSGSLVFNGAGGRWTFARALAVNSGASITLTAGTLDTAGFAVQVGSFSSTNSNTRALLGGSTWTLTATNPLGGLWNIFTSTNMTLTAVNITVGSASTSPRSVSWGGFTYGTLTYTVAGSTGFLYMNNSSTFGSWVLSDATNARTIEVQAGTTQTVTGALTISGTSGKLTTFISDAAGTQWSLSVASGTVSLDYLSLMDSNATGGATFYAGANSTNVSGNTGWIFAAPLVAKALLLIKTAVRRAANF